MMHCWAFVIRIVGLRIKWFSTDKNCPSQRLQLQQNQWPMTNLCVISAAFTQYWIVVYSIKRSISRGGWIENRVSVAQSLHSVVDRQLTNTHFGWSQPIKCCDRSIDLQGLAVIRDRITHRAIELNWFPGWLDCWTVCGVHKKTIFIMYEVRKYVVDAPRQQNVRRTKECVYHYG